MSHFDIKWQVTPLKLKEVFTISRSSRTEVPNVFLSLTKDGVTGYGEASPNSRYDETPEKVEAYFRELPPDMFNAYSVEELAAALDEMDKLMVSPRNVQDETVAKYTVRSAKTAIEMAWLDWNAKKHGIPLWQLWEEVSPVGPVTSFTIGIDTPSKMQQKVRDAEAFPVFKIKLGTDHDRELIKAIREVTDKPLRVDANEGWKTLDQAKSEIEFLTEQNVEMVEQPMPSAEFKMMKELKRWSPVPLCADESFMGDEDLREIAEAFHVINIKLMKTGSIIKAREIVEDAHKLGLQVMVGCMIESSLANAAGALIALNAEYADLDGHLLISNDPFEGLNLNEDGRVVLSDLAGFGVKKS